MNDSRHIGLGIIGCGGFGLFALQHFVQVPGVRLVAMAGTHREASIAAAKRFGIPDVESIDQLLSRPDVDLVYIATPPFLHHPQAMAALDAGKHVICEKPLALTLEQANEMIDAARRGDRLLIANLIQRYNPLADSIKNLIESRLLGELLHGFFENYAADEGLPLDHWFWDREKSGGIFVEHGVHFFDLLSSWLGPGQVVAAQRSLRSVSSVEEQVQCTVRYGRSVLMNFYHGFHQPGRLDRQELRLVFERGEVRLFEWIPSRMHIHAIADESTTRAICDLFSAARLEITQVYSAHTRRCVGRHKELDAYQLIELYADEAAVKLHRYGALLRALLSDQIAWIEDRRHPRRITEQNGRDSLAMALASDKFASTTEDVQS